MTKCNSTVPKEWP